MKRKLWWLIAFLTFLYCSGLLHAQTPVQLAPNPNIQFFDGSGLPLAGGKLYTYQAGTSTPQPAYAENTGTTPLPNPIILNSSGFVVNATGGMTGMWFVSACYRMVLQNSSSVTIWTADNVCVPVSASANNTFTGNNTFSGTTTFNGPVVTTAGGTLGGSFAGNPNFTGSPVFSGAVAFPAGVTGPLTINGNLTVTGAVTYPGVLKKVVSGSSTLSTVGIASGACDGQTFTATGALQTDTLTASFNGDVTGTTGYSPSTNGMLTIIPFTTADTVNFVVCNNTLNSITPGAVMLNWIVTR